MKGRGVVACMAVAATGLAFGGSVLDGFREAPLDCRPETWLQVSGGNASKEGMTLDLEAIAAAGFSGVQFFHEQFGGVKAWPGVTNQIPCLSPGWNDFIGHTARECRRLGLRFVMHSCPGWSLAGGPWIPADRTMRELVAARAEAEGAHAIRLPRPRKADDAPWRDYRDIAVVAFPAPKGDVLVPLKPVSVVGSRTSDKALVRSYYSDPVVVKGKDDERTSASNWWNAAVGDGTCRFSFPETNGTVEVELDFGKLVTVRTLELSPVQRFNHFWSFQPDVTVFVFAATREGEWREISRRPMPQSTWQDEKFISLALPETQARRFKVELRHVHPLVLSSVKFYSGARPDNWEAESAGVLRALMEGGDAQESAGAFIDPSEIADLTSRLGSDGRLDWSPPPGRWTVLRVGHVNSGIRNHPAPPEATGWECDKLAPRGADAHWNGFVGRLAAAGGPLEGGLLGGVLMDSWECEAQTWTDGLDAAFRGRWGYALDRWWPALFGYVVKGRRDTSLFYRDWREMLGDLVAENFYGRYAETVHRNGMFITYQTCGGDVFPCDPMKHWKYADEPMCEFWRHRTKFGGVGSLDYKAIRPCVSAARIYGKPRVSAEALTCTGLDWRTEYPRAWKADLDYYLAQGVSHMTFENYTHDPRIGGLPPGTGYAAILGTVLCRGQTWWRAMRDVTDYLARAQRMLESGKSVSDVLLYLGDRVDHKPPQHLPFPSGFVYDYLNRDALLSRFSVRDGKWVTPEGLSWSALWIYDERDLRPETVAYLAEAEKKGAKIIRGDVFKGVAALGLKPSVKADPRLVWQHRRTSDEEIYFFAETDGAPFDGQVDVLGEGEVFLADPVTGDVSPADVASFNEGYASVRLRLGRAGAKFLVVRKGPARTGGGRNGAAVREIAVPGPWRISFAKGWCRDEPLQTERLMSWHELPGSQEAKSYSGEAVYRATFTLDARAARAERIVLDLGEVECVAEVKVNGSYVGRAWTWPYSFDVKAWARPGANALEIAVVGSWHNRLRYDATLPEAQRLTWTLGYPNPQESPLQPSGLLGPVKVVLQNGRDML